MGDSLTSKPRLEPVAILAAVAARTSRVRIGTAVLLPALRHPVTLAHSLATVDVLSKGRLVIGAGVGGTFTPEQKAEWLAVGVTPSSRAGRLTEAVQIMKLLWTEDHVSFSGRYYDLEDVTLYPKPVQPGGVPILLATHYHTGSDAQSRRAAHLADGVIGITDTPEHYALVAQRVIELAKAEGRDLSGMERALYLTVNVDRDTEAASADAEDFLMAYYQVRHWGERWGPWGDPERVAGRMAEYAQAGANHLVMRFASWDQARQLEGFVRDVVPAFRALTASAV